MFNYKKVMKLPQKLLLPRQGGNLNSFESREGKISGFEVKKKNKTTTIV